MVKALFVNVFSRCQTVKKEKREYAYRIADTVVVIENKAVKTMKYFFEIFLKLVTLIISGSNSASAKAEITNTKLGPRVRENKGSCLRN